MMCAHELCTCTHTWLNGGYAGAGSSDGGARCGTHGARGSIRAPGAVGAQRIEALRTVGAFVAL